MTETPLAPIKGKTHFWFNPEQPLWLPPGTISALIVLLFASAVVIPLLKFAAYREEIPQTVKEVVLFMAGGLYPIISQYLEGRKKQRTAEGTEPREEKT